MKRKIISLLLILCVAVSMVPAQVFAAQQSSRTNPFDDVRSTDWYYDAVRYVYENGIFLGTSDTRFTPNGTMTRAMFVTVLGRMAGVDPSVYAGESSFVDVDPSSYYAPYVAWAAKHGITSGTGSGKFSPDALINREQMAVFFVRYFEIFDVDFDTGVNITTTPADIIQVSDFARDAVLKLWKTGLLNGDGVNFNPKGNAARAQAAALCMRTDDAVEVWYKEPGVPSNRVRRDFKTEGTSEPNVGATYYTFKFNTNGGSSISDRSIREGNKLDNLPTPYKENAIFIGWYYDQTFTQPVLDTDTAKKSTILYAKYEELAPLNQEFMTPVASALDVNKNFTVSVKAPVEMTLNDFKDAVTLINLSSNENKEWFKITGGSGTFILSGVNYLGAQGAQQPGFVEGSAYKIILEDKNLYFAGQDQSAREYVFTIKREEVVNVSFNAQLKQIPLSDISDLMVNGASASTISIPVITVGVDGAPAENGVTNGSFTFSNGTLAVGDTIMIYEGSTPPAMDAVGNNENTAFVEITAVSGNRYTYKTAAAENVLFTPDILPVSVNADTDGKPSNNSITVPISVMTYTDDHFAMAGLDSQTTIDVGDFISFYSGTLTENGTLASGGSIKGYAQITSVQLSPDKQSYIIDYKPVTLSELQKAMAAYKKENIESEELLEGADTQAIEKSVEKQARESGFAEEAGMYLAALALETDSFTQLRDDYELTAVEMTMNGRPITQETLQSMGASKAEVELSKLSATLNTKLEHFKGLKGLRLTLEVGVKVTIECNDDVSIEINITGFFEQEVRVDIGVDGDAVWEWWGIFPYIAEYEVTAFVELYEYTGIGVEATIVTVETDDDGDEVRDGTAESIGSQIKALMEETDKYIGDGTKTISDSLEDKYSDMLENESAWVTLFEKSLLDNDFHVLAVIAINIEIKFVVSANLNISLGMDFWYENAKRYVYTIQVFDKKVKSDVIDLVEEHWEFEFYVMGTMGLRAGIKAGISVGLFSTKLASVGFSAEAGAYVRVWGYFYYQLKYTASQGRSSAYSGALYLEFGIYLEVNFEAQALNGKFSYEKTLFEKEWPLLKAGDRDNVRDFAYQQKDAPNIKLKSYITSARLPDAVFNMTYLDLKEGMEKDKDGNRVLSVANYDKPLGDRTGLSQDKLDDEKNFIVEMSNPAFVYDPETNTVSVVPGGEVKHEGEMTITWKNRPMEFSSRPIRRTITLYWDNLKDGYVIAPFTNGGSYVPMILGKYEEAVTAPEDPTKLGYLFGGWYSDESLTEPYTFPKTMPNVDTSIYARWVPATDTPYTVEHYQQRLGSSEYDLVERESFKGTTDSTVTPLTKAYTGFKTPNQETLVIKPDGSSILRYYYDRQTYTVTFEPGEVGGESVVIRLKYGSTISAPQFGAEGYIFKGWDKTIATYMGDQDLTYTALWEKEPTAEYRVEYYVQQPDGKFILQQSINGTGATGDEIVASSLRRDDLYVEAGITSFRNVTVSGEQKDIITLTSDGKTVIKVNYERTRYTVTFKPENGTEDIIYSLYAGAKITPPKVNQLGYTLVEWEPEIPETVGTMPLTFTAIWSGTSGSSYLVKHVRQDLDNTYPNDGELVEYVEMSGTTGNDTEAQPLSYEGFTVQPFTQEKIAYNGSTVVEIRYSRSKYKVEWQSDGATYPVDVPYGAIIQVPDIPQKAGYVIDYWEGFAENTIMDTTPKTYTAVWKEATDTPYTVKHIFANVDGTYPVEGESVVTEVKYGTTFDKTAAAAKHVKGFTAQNVTQADIQPNGETTVSIYYDRNTYSVTWMVDNEIYDITEVIYGDMITQPDKEEPTKTGYSLDQWMSAYEKMPAKAISVTAKFKPETYEVGFEGGTAIIEPLEPIQVTYGVPYGSQLPMPEITTGDALVFVGWMDAEGNIIKAETVVKIAAHHSLTALWANENERTYTVRHMLQKADEDGYDLDEEEIRYGLIGESTNAQPRDYKGFITPQEVEQDVIEEDNVIVIEIRYDRKTHDITWEFDNGYNPLTRTYRYDQTIAIPQVPTRDGYRFIGWNEMPPEKMPDKELAFTARWTEGTYTISFDANGGGANPEPIKVTNKGKYPALPKISRAGYTFDGWYTPGGEPVEEGDTVDITHDSTLYAQWIPNTYEVSFDLNGLEGEAPERITVTYGSTYENLPGEPATKTGYRFKGWYMAPHGGDRITGETVVAITKNTTLYAQMEPNTYKVRFEANGSNGVMPDQLHTYDRALALSDIKFNKPGHSFMGWNTQPDGGGTSYSNRDSVINLTATHNDVITLYAQWSINTYTITFDSEGGTTVDPISGLYDTVVEKPEDPEKLGYVLDAWMYWETPVSFPLSLIDNINLTARWKPAEYAITYFNMEGVANSNPSYYTIESDSISLNDPGEKPGYTFMGWYADESLCEESKVDGVAISWGSTGSRTFYASWKANVYGVNFDDGTESNNVGGRMSSQTFVYDVEQPLKTNEFSLTGYRFAGWGLAPKGGVLYADGETVKNLVPSGSITLYAQWELITYTISYTLGTGASNANNLTGYTIETADITLKNPGDVKPGYRFMGWYNGNTKVTSIPKGSTGNVALTAKWEHGGIFTLAKTGETSGTTKDITFTVTRTFPADATPTDDVQYVYYRTVNGTAIGGTAAPIHFSHVGGEDIFLTFSKNETKKAFVVRSERANTGSGDIVNSFTNGVDRYYDVELYKVDSASKICTGTLGTTSTVRRTLTQDANYKLTGTLLTKSYGKYITTTPITVNHHGFGSNTSHSVTTGLFGAANQTALEQYAAAAGNKIGLRLQMSVSEIDDGYQHIEFARSSNLNQRIEWKFEIERNHKNSSWHNLYIPITGTQGVIVLTETTKNVMDTTNSGGVTYVSSTIGEKLVIRFDASGQGGDDWQYDDLYISAKILDTAEPAVKRIAPMAYGKYKKDEVITIAVEFNEIINTATGVSMNAFSPIPVSSWTYQSGAGTNVLVFTGKLTGDFNVTPDTNMTLTGTKPTINGTIRDLVD